MKNKILKLMMKKSVSFFFSVSIFAFAQQQKNTQLLTE